MKVHFNTIDNTFCVLICQTSVFCNVQPMVQDFGMFFASFFFIVSLQNNNHFSWLCIFFIKVTLFWLSHYSSVKYFLFCFGNIQANLNIHTQSIQRRLCICKVQWMIESVLLGQICQTKSNHLYMHACPIRRLVGYLDYSLFIKSNDLCICKVYVHWSWPVYLVYFCFVVRHQSVENILATNFPLTKVCLSIRFG